MLLSVDMAGTADVAGRHILLVSLLHAQLHRAGSLTINREGLRPEASLLPASCAKPHGGRSQQ